MDRYEIIIYWSAEDQAYVAEVPELPGCSAHGDTYESALSQAMKAVALWIETAIEFNDPYLFLKDAALPMLDRPTKK